MSIYLAYKYDNCIKLLTDGASWDEHGHLAKVASKVHTARTLPLAVTGRGNDAVVNHLAAEIVGAADRCGSVDTVVEVFDKLFLAMKGTALADMSSHTLRFDLLITGYSLARGFFILSLDATPGGEENLVLRDGGKSRVGVAIPPDPDFAKPFQTGIREDDKRFLKLRGVELVEAIRRAGCMDRTEWGEKVPFRGAMAGGIVELTTITETGTRTELLKDFHDPLGSPINAYRDAGNVTTFSTRKERRAAKRRAA